MYQPHISLPCKCGNLYEHRLLVTYDPELKDILVYLELPKPSTLLGRLKQAFWVLFRMNPRNYKEHVLSKEGYDHLKQFLEVYGDQIES